MADGAAYNPDTDAWTPLPPAPSAARANPVVTWTGTRVVLLGGQPTTTDVSSDVGEYTDGAAYDPAMRTWTRILPPVHTAGQTITWSKAVATDHSVLAWAEWQVGHQKASSTGTDLFSCDPQTNLWTYELPTAGELLAVREAVWTGHEVFAVGPPEICRAGCTGTEARIYHPDTNTWSVTPADPSVEVRGRSPARDPRRFHG